MDDLKVIGHLFYTTSSFVHHFKSIDESKLELQSQNAEFGSKSLNFSSSVTLTFDGWLWKTVGHLYFKLCAFLRSHRWNKIEGTIRKQPIWVKIDDFLCRVTLKFDGWPWKNDKAPLLCHIKFCAFIAICEIKVELRSGNGLIGVWPLWPWPLTSDLDLWIDNNFVIGNNSWNFQDDTMRRTFW